MAKKTSKTAEVSKFGGVDDLGTIKEVGNLEAFTGGIADSTSIHPDVNWEAKSLETQSQTKLEADEGFGGIATIRRYDFGINPETWRNHPPSKQELFNAHYKGIEMSLWGDGMKVNIDVNPRVVVDPEKKIYSIFVVAVPRKGWAVNDMPQTLSQIVNGR